VAAIFDTAKQTIMRYSASTIALCIALLWFTSCKKEKDGPQPPSGPPPAAITVTDVDGNIYSTTTIGGQVWMAEDLRTGTYNDGTPIPNLTEGWPWVQATAGAWCYYENDSSHGTIYGKLYNWYAAAHPMICPEGWHVPTDADWQQLEATLGMPTNFLGQIGYRGAAQNVGGKMKATSLWVGPNLGATNESGFSGLPGGSRYDNGEFVGQGEDGRWWSASEEGLDDEAWDRILSSNGASIGRHYISKRNGFCVRCVRD
jgi:uncharacterized protein (TIGR02145 family)